MNDPTAENVFGKVAELYDEVRPAYPQQLVDDVLAWSDLPDSARLLEIGCGTGKATRLFAPSGFHITAIDPAAGMLQVARSTCTEHSNVEFFESKFEEWPLPDEPYDLVYSAQAFHWIDPVKGLSHAADALRDGGAFSLFWNTSTWPNTELRKEIDDAYQRFASELDSPAIGEKNSRLWPDVVRDSGHFTDIETGVYEWRKDYDEDTWIRLLQTHSDHRVMDPEQLNLLLSAIAEAISRHGGVLTVDYVTQLVLARKT